MGRPPFICDSTIATHQKLTDPQLRTHYQHGCRDELTRAAKTRGQRLATAAASSSTAPSTDAEADALTAPAEPIRAVPRPPSTDAQVSALGTCRRLQGLVRIGFTPRQLGAHLKLQDSTVWLLLFWPPQTIKTSTHAAVAQMFRTLRDQLPVDGGDAADQSKLMAIKYDWALPYSWEDIDFDDSAREPRRSLAEPSAELELLREQLRTANLTIKQLSGTRKPVPAAAPECDHAGIVDANAELNLELIAAHADVARLTAQIEQLTAGSDTAPTGRHRAPADVAAEAQLLLDFAPRSAGGFTIAIQGQALTELTRA